MITIRKALQSDQKAWDNFVVNHPSSSPYHFFAWQVAVQEAYQHYAHYLIAEQSSEIVGIFPIIIFKKPFGQSTLCALPFCDIGGVLANEHEIEQLLLNKAAEVALTYHANKIDHRTAKTNKETSESSELFSNSDKVRMIMPLPESSEVLFSNFKSKLRSQIRKADKNGLHFELGSQETLLNDFYGVFAHNMRALGSPVHAKQFFVSLLKHYKSKMLISVVYKDELAIGAGIVLVAGNKASIPWASTKAEYNRLSPNMMLYWSFLQHLSDNGISEFDFGRSSFDEGTFKFKQQWGALPQPLNWTVINISEPSRDTKSQATTPSNLRGKVESIWRKLPLAVTILLGPIIRKYISL